MQFEATWVTKHKTETFDYSTVRYHDDNDNLMRYYF